MTDDIKVTILYGVSVPRAWFEMRTDERGDVVMVGMGSRTDYDLDGNITFHKVEPTGLVARIN